MSLAPPFSQSTINDVFGSWSSYRKSLGLGPHRGVDWAPAGGGAIRASGSGVVTFARWNAALGNEVVVRYDDGGVHIGYCHMAGPTPLAVGTRVQQGDVLGEVGNTGSASGGRHLHMTASWSNGDPGTVAVIDPLQFFGAAVAVASLAAVIILAIQKGLAMPSDYRAFEQNQSAGQPGYLEIGVTGPGIDGMFKISPADRNPYNVLRSVLNTYSAVNGDGSQILPENGLSIDAIAWDVLTRVFAGSK